MRRLNAFFFSFFFRFYDRENQDEPTVAQCARKTPGNRRNLRLPFTKETIFFLIKPLKNLYTTYTLEQILRICFRVIIELLRGPVGFEWPLTYATMYTERSPFLFHIYI